MKFLIFSFLLFAFSGCMNPFLTHHFIQPIRQPDNEVLITGVPFYPQSQNQCGPSSLASVFSFWGKNIPFEKIDIYSDKLKGTLFIDMDILAVKEGFSTKLYSGSIDDLQQKISSGIPLILFVDLGIINLKVGHYMVVYGYNDMSRYIVADSGGEQQKILSYSFLEKIWKRTGYFTFMVYPGL